MVKTCCVKNCDIGPNGKITCFRFPSSRLLKRQWIDAIGLSNKLTANSTICIKHFQEDDYDIVRGRPRLKARVIPSVFTVTFQDDPPNEPIARDTSPINIDSEIVTTTDEHSANNVQKNVQCTNKDDKSTENTDKINEETGNKTHDGNDKHDKAYETEIIEDTHKDSEKINERNEKDNETREENEKQDVTHEESEKQDNTHERNEKHNNTHKESEKQRDNSNQRNDKQKDETRDINEKQKEAHESNEKQKNETHERNEKHEKERDEIEKQKEKKNKPNGILSKRKKRKVSAQCLERVPQTSNMDDLSAKDIEDIIINYQIKQTRPLHTLEPEEKSVEQKKEDGSIEKSNGEVKESDPVFIEVSVQGKGDRAGSPRDCLMVLESVEVELDPSTFLTDGEHPDADCHETVDLDDDHDDGKQDPISLLTSSDEDEVIIQEPHIDTVEVSDETDEDDLPLVKLIKRPKKKKKLWDTYEYYCVDCPYSTSSRKNYKAHTGKHSTIIQVCQFCDYTSASKVQFMRHKRKHKDDKRFKCHLCDYKARHNMSLIYHLKTHRAVSNAKRGYKCDKCGFTSDVKSGVVRHVKLCMSDVKWFSCDKCVYATKRQSDLRRHKARRHSEDSEEEFVP